MKNVVLPNAEGPLVAEAHSMGGHNLFRYLGEEKDQSPFDLALMSSPMLSIRTDPTPPAAAKVIAAGAVKLGFERNYAPGEKPFDPNAKFEDNVDTHDRQNFLRFEWIETNNPVLRVGGATYGWLDACLRSCDKVAQKGFPEGIRTPILMFSATEDKLVYPETHRQLAVRTPDCELNVIEGAYHEVLFETPDIVARVNAAEDAFLAKNLPAVPRRNAPPPAPPNPPASPRPPASPKPPASPRPPASGAFQPRRSGQTGG